MYVTSPTRYKHGLHKQTCAGCTLCHALAVLFTL
jgi:formate hydrogenlyase subunit 6/NADH:ubiquinone oxidoreductase subunit I